MKKVLAAVIATVIIAALAVSVFADYPKSETFIYDGAEMLSEEAEAEIKSVSDALFVAKGVRIAVCTVDNTGDIPANTYARGVFGEWGVNGVLILAVKSTEFYYAVQSSSIADTLTDEKLGEIMNTVLEPEFAAGNYSAGFSATVKAISSFISENVKTPEAADKSSSEAPKKKNGFVIFLVIVLIIAAILGGGYGLLVYLEKKQERERRLRLEEKRRRLAQSGRGNYFGAPSNGRNAYGQSPAGRGDFDREYGARSQGERGGDRFVYPESSPTARPGQRMQNPVNNVNRRTVSAPPRGQRVDFDREYYRGTPAGEENVDASATREFTRH
ncbi:MAG: TPM domain-containing protein [Clostridia bacterium]|nr:TPM domain-containing protein [Clostridia bacterium]